MVGVRVSASTEPEVPSAPALAAGLEGSATGAAAEGATGGAGGRAIPDDCEGMLAVGSVDSWVPSSPSSSELSSSAVSCLWLQWIGIRIWKAILMNFDLKDFDFQRY